MGNDYRVRGDVIRYHRKRSRLTQQQLAERAGLSLGQVSRIEGGKIETPHFGTIERIATALGMESDDFIEWLMPIPA